MNTTTNPTRENVLAEVIYAVTDYYDRPAIWDPAGPFGAYERRRDEQTRRARLALAAAMDWGLDMCQVSSDTKISGALLIPLISDTQARADAYAAEVHHHERAAEHVREMRITEARARHREGETPSDLAASFGVTRATVDDWLSRIVVSSALDIPPEHV